jgi:hypothetical protein
MIMMTIIEDLEMKRSPSIAWKELHHFLLFLDKTPSLGPSLSLSPIKLKRA